MASTYDGILDAPHTTASKANIHSWNDLGVANGDPVFSDLIKDRKFVC